MVKRTAFWLALALQLGLLLIIPIPRWWILAYGKTVVLETIPYDPYTVFSGYYADLRYKISDPEYLSRHFEFKDLTEYYVLLKPDQDGIWKPRQVTTKLPPILYEREVVIKGKLQYYSMKYGIEQYYLPETKRHVLERLLRDRRAKVLVVAKVSRDGTAVVQELRVGKQVFRY